MNQLKLYNSLTRRTEDFAPRRKGQVKLFTCGPSVYRRQHVGNYRTYLFEDILHKYLRYMGLEVDRIINFTDFEDKGIKEARQSGVSIEELRQPVEEAFFSECDMLGIYLPDNIPRATTSVDSAVELIEHLIDRGHAYWHKDEVFYDPLTFDGFGRLFGLDMGRWPDKKIRFRRDTYPGNRWYRGDFILWHKHSKQDGDVFWDTRIGQGRPAWNIRFFLLYGPYRDKLDLRISEVEQKTGHLDRLCRQMDTLFDGMTGNSEGRQTKLAASMRAAFEKHMNADLNCAGVFDTLTEQLERAVQLNASGNLPEQDRKALRDIVIDIDKVFGVFGMV